MYTNMAVVSFSLLNDLIIDPNKSHLLVKYYHDQDDISSYFNFCEALEVDPNNLICF